MTARPARYPHLSDAIPAGGLGWLPCRHCGATVSRNHLAEHDAWHGRIDRITDLALAMPNPDPPEYLGPDSVWALKSALREAAADTGYDLD